MRAQYGEKNNYGRNPRHGVWFNNHPINFDTLKEI